MNFWEFLKWAWEDLGYIEGLILTLWLIAIYWAKKSIDKYFNKNK